jgi:acyl carrier protein
MNGLTRIMLAIALCAVAGVARADALEFIKGVISSTDPELQVGPESSFEDDLGMDELDKVELIMSVETEFHISIPDDHAADIKTVNDLVVYLKRSGVE